VERLGYLQMSVLVPDSKGMVPTRYKVGALDECVRAAIDYANANHNVYIEGRTIRPETERGRRGDADDTEWVFALVIDSDADKGQGVKLDDIQPTMTVESSPGNKHYWFFVEKALDTGSATAPRAVCARSLSATSMSTPAASHRNVPSSNWAARRPRRNTS
jgi:hypothetical protein